VRLIKAALYPLDDSTSISDIESHLRALERVGAVCRYKVAGRMLLHVTGFSVHQRIAHPTTSVLPACDLRVHEPLGSPPESFVNPPEPVGKLPPRARAHTSAEVEVEVEVEVEREVEVEGAAKTAAQRAQALAGLYTEQVPMSRYPAVLGIIRKAIDAGKPDIEITDALRRIAAEGRSLTVETLRIELEGQPALGSNRKRAGDTILRAAWEKGS